MKYSDERIEVLCDEECEALIASMPAFAKALLITTGVVEFTQEDSVVKIKVLEEEDWDYIEVLIRKQ